MATWLGIWGRERSSDERACALAAAGVLAVQQRELRDVLLEDGPIGWQWPKLAALGDPAALARAWRDARGERAVRLRIGTSSEPVPAASLELQQMLGAGAVVGAGAASIQIAPRHPCPPWRWPLDLGVPPGAEGDRVAAVLEQARFTGELAHVQRLGRPHWRSSVLVLPGTLTEAAAAALAMHRSVRAALVVVLGRPASTLDRSLASLRLILDLTHAHAIAVGPAPIAWRRCLESLVEHLAQDEPLDLALARASLDSGERIGAVLASDQILDELRLSRRLAAVTRGLSDLEDTGYLGATPARTSSGGMREVIARSMSSGSWQSEIDFGTGVARAERDLEDRAAAPPPRWMQARLEDDARAAVEAANPGRDYRILLKVGPKDAAFRPLAHPVEALPVSQRDERLMVVVTDPELAPVPLVEWIALPPTGASTTATFALATPERCARIEARIALFHDGRLLQTGVLRAECDGRSPWRFELDAVARAQLANLDRRHHFGASLIANHTSQGQPGFLAAEADGKAARLAISDHDIAHMIEGLSLGFDELRSDPRPIRTLRDASSVAALRTLARRGATFHQSLVADNEVGPALLTTDPIQIVSARANTFFPLELAYRYPTPALDAPLCEHAEAALERGSCDASCGGGTAQRMCPLGFWSLSRVIERCSFRPKDPRLEADFELTVEPVRTRTDLVKPARAALAASDIAKKRAATAITDLSGALASAFGGGPLTAAPDWTEWQRTVQSEPWPALLVLVPHHAQENGEEFLEIGAAARLHSPDVQATYVIGDRPIATTPRPIVLLAGCETALSSVSYESFVSRLRLSGAAVVLGTIATVLGLDAAPVAGEVAAELVRAFGQRPPRTIGDAMLAVRRRLVASGRVMVLSLAAYGDADWQLA